MAWFILYYTLELFKWLIIARAIMSWFVSPHSKHPIVTSVRRLTDPILRPLSELVPLAGGIDLSPILAFFAITLIQQAIFRIA
jgi:YggT family protein